MLPRSADIGFALSLAQQLRMFIVKPQRPGEPYAIQERRGQPPVFEARHVCELVRYLKQRLLTVEK